MAAPRSKAGVEAAVSSEAEDEAAACSRVGSKDSRRRQHQ
jgi:hypothetical protein